MDVLAEAIDLNSILPIEDDSEPIAIQHIQANHYNAPTQPIVQQQQYQTVPFSQPQIVQHDPNVQHRSIPICYNCNEEGHMSRECQKPNQRNGNNRQQSNNYENRNFNRRDANNDQRGHQSLHTVSSPPRQ
jgi:hypothetical protein